MGRAGCPRPRRRPPPARRPGGPGCGPGGHAVRLETNRTLAEAIALYRSAGYTEVPPFNDEPYAHHWFAKPL